jgi:hypothetical protein
MTAHFLENHRGKQEKITESPVSLGTNIRHSMNLKGDNGSIGLVIIE